MQNPEAEPIQFIDRMTESGGKQALKCYQSKDANQVLRSKIQIEKKPKLSSQKYWRQNKKYLVYTGKQIEGKPRSTTNKQTNKEGHVDLNTQRREC